MRRLRRKSLFQQLAQNLEDDLKDAIWTGHLPGYRTLQNVYGVSKSTCEKALQLLESKGVLAPAEPGKRREILHQIQQGTHEIQGNLLLIHDITHQSNQEILNTLNAAGSFWRERGGGTLFKAVDFGLKRKPDSLIKNWVESSDIDGIVLLVPPQAWIDAAVATGIPVFQFGGACPSQASSTTKTGHSSHDCAVMCFEHLKSLGHSRILMPWKQAHASLRPAISLAYEEVFGVSLSMAQLDSLIPLVDHHSALDWRRYWHTALSWHEPTCVILDHSLEALSLIGFCGKYGIKIPSHLSLFLFSGISLREWIEPNITFLQFDPKAEHRCFMKWVREGLPTKGFLPQVPNLVIGDSIRNLNHSPAHPLPNLNPTSV